jgi:hypothetical protein
MASSTAFSVWWKTGAWAKQDGAADGALYYPEALCGLFQGWQRTQAQSFL